MRRIILLVAALLAFEGSFAVAQPPDPVEKPAPDQGTEAEDQDAPATTDLAPNGGDPAGAQVDSVQADSPASQETPEWMIGHWCTPHGMLFRITVGDYAIMGGRIGRFRLQDRGDGMTEVYLQFPSHPGPGDDSLRVALFMPSEGEPSFRTFQPGIASWPLYRCGRPPSG
jgi:hypothetical protein